MAASSVTSKRASWTVCPAARIRRGGLRQPPGIRAVQHDRRAGLGQPLGHGAAQPARGAGDEGGAPGQVEKFASHVPMPPNGGR